MPDLAYRSVCDRIRLDALAPELAVFAIWLALMIRSVVSRITRPFGQSLRRAVREREQCENPLKGRALQAQLREP